MKHKCSKCKRTRLARFFAYRNKERGTRVSYCKDCQSKYYKKYYGKNPDKHVQRATRSNIVVKERNTDLVNKLKDVPCADCKQRYKPWQMDFDHLPAYDKIGNISQLLVNGATDKLKAELTKCEVVCSNCHRNRTYFRRRGSTIKAPVL